jgi:hypothetical protein
MAETQGTDNTGCSVDWSWLAGRKIASATNDLQSITIVFEDGQTLKIQALLYKDAAFLSFNPYQNPANQP